MTTVPKGLPLGARAEAYPGARVAGYTLLVLTVANIFSYVDRIIMNLMVGPLKDSLQINDTQIALLQGVAFGLFYTLAAIPIGRLVDVWDRRLIISIGTTVFSACTVAAGFCQTYWQLFLARLGTGAGEATLGPASHSLLADTVPKDRLAGALGVFVMGAFIGMGCAYIFGGFVVQWALNAPPIDLPLLPTLRPWQLAFVVAGLPGLLAAWWVATLKEPPRRGVAEGAAHTSLPVNVVLRHIRTHWRMYVPMLGGYGFVTLNGHAVNSWTPAFLQRVHGLEAHEVGLSLGLLTLFCATLGCLSAGKLADLLSRRGLQDAPLIGSVIGLGLALVPSILGPLFPSLTGSLICFAIREFFIVFPYPLAAAAIQLATPNKMRGQMAALYFLTINIIGLGLGPTVVGLMSDHIFTEAGGVRYSLAVVATATLPFAIGLLLLSRGAYRRARSELDAAG